MCFFYSVCDCFDTLSFHNIVLERSHGKKKHALNHIKLMNDQSKWLLKYIMQEKQYIWFILQICISWLSWPHILLTDTWWQGWCSVFSLESFQSLYMCNCAMFDCYSTHMLSLWSLLALLHPAPHHCSVNWVKSPITTSFMFRFALFTHIQVQVQVNFIVPKGKFCLSTVQSCFIRTSQKTLHIIKHINKIHRK